MAMLRTLVSLAFTGMLVNVAMATSYTVGLPGGSWDTITNLQGWASSQSFSSGDNLVFQYMPIHDVLEVTKADYDSCQTTNPLQTHTGGNTIVPLTSPGKRYFICGTPGHCSQGMKLEIDTLATSAPPPTSPATPTPTATPSTPPPTSPTTPPPTTPSTPPPASPATHPPTATPSTAPHSSPISPVSSPPPRSAAHPPMNSPKSAPTMSPPTQRKSPVSSPTSSAVAPSTESPANSPSPSGFPLPPPSSATKVNTLVGTMGFGFSMVMLLTL